MKQKIHRTSTAACLVIAILILATLCGCAVPRQAMQENAVRPEQAKARWEEQGIKVVRVSHAVKGMMLDLRFRITDFEAARQALKKTTPISLVDQRTGMVLTVPNMAKVGKLRNVPSSDDPGRLYWMFFNNPGGLVKAGSKVTLAIGDVKIKDIRVE